MKLVTNVNPPRLTVSFEGYQQSRDEATTDAAVHQFRKSLKPELRWEMIQLGVWVVLFFMEIQQRLLKVHGDVYTVIF